MLNGSTRSRDPSGPRRMRGRNRANGPLLVVCALVIGGCHPPTLRDSLDLQAELANVTTDDLLVLALSHARSGDLLRAEQYLSAARQRGRDEAGVVYWLVRVCVAANRYQSALTHAANHLRDHPLDWPLRLVVATIHEALGHKALARSEFERIVAAQPLMALPHYRLAMLYREGSTEPTRAIMHLQEYLKLEPGGPHAAEARSALNETVALTLVPAALPPSGPTQIQREVAR